jgi:hypothetical protein
MATVSQKSGKLGPLLEYFSSLGNQSPFWKLQSIAVGVVLTIMIFGGVIVAILTFSSIYGGGNLSYKAMGSPGPVVFRHYTHMTFKDGKYRECGSCHDKIFAAQKYGTFVLRALDDSPPLKVHIGKDFSTLFVPGSQVEEETAMVTYAIPRACATCATGACHDGKESFSRFNCLGCHKAK